MQIKLWGKDIPFFDDSAETPNLLETFFMESDSADPRPCIVILPGGGYSHRAPHEGKPIAEFFNARGMHAAIVQYRVAPNRHPAPLADVQRAVKILRSNAKAWNIDPNKIVTLGFSAGGHLCASAITLSDVTKDRIGADAIDRMDAMPNGAILCYAVISVDELFGHVGSGKNLLGERYDQEKENLSLQNRVSKSTPKAFIWHTSDDNVVNVKNSLIFGEKLRDCGIPFEMHIYPHGRHGLGLAEAFEDVSGWADLAADWVLRNI